MKILNSKLVKRFLVVLVVGFVLGVFLYFLTDKTERGAIGSSLINYINMIKNSTFDYGDGLLNTLVYNFKFITLIWICGIIFILVFVPYILLFFKSFLVGYTFINIIATFGIKGILYGVILLVPSLINIFILLLMCYYSVRFAGRTYNIMKNNNSVNLKQYIKNYCLIYIILSFVTLLSGLFEVYGISNLLKLVV